jgi:transposase-like protein
VWLYHRFPLSFREVEEMTMARGVIVCYETIHGGAAGSVRASLISCVAVGHGQAKMASRRSVHQDPRSTHYLWRAVKRTATCWTS